MALTPEQKAEAHRRGLEAKAEREARMDKARARNNRRIGGDYGRFRAIGLSHEEALAEIEKRKIAEERFKEERGDISPLGGGTYTGPRGGRYRINSNGRKSYDVP